MEEMRNLEEMVLNELVERGTPVKVFFVNGYQAVMEILDFNCDVLLVKKDGRKQMVYRHAVSTIDMG